ncbi:MULTISPECIES: DUF6449 domain-containing protein [unclassified Cytobacillus]|uniref:DUF6449 domain-containing protein n=1 Tax=unclassified Cytobacillus TaxID=2675268 RepID=UPI001356FCB0|nr:DUF6449 domain-containing protein [Cytobacillus sp. AMY 15.2]KAF0819876.1 hypothetical protein KIS4809_1148 [Bacillus sp. ZZV12-4809]MCM3092253.1 DUF6449 domain-containing protein [Cytobacillus sp. AMY 15.2]
MKWGTLDMQSKTSLIKREILKTIFRSVGWVSIVYFLGLFFAIPLDIIMNSSEEQRKFLDIENLYQYNFQLQFILSISVPVILSVFLFRYTQVKQYSDLLHSLPVKRESIFHQYALTGIMLLILPVLLIALIVLFLYQPLNLQDFYSVGEIIKWVGITLLFNMVLYMTGVSVGMLTGLSAVQGVLTYIFLLLPVGLIILVSINLPYYLFGFPDQYYMTSKFEKFSPLITITQMNERTPSSVEAVIYLLLIVCLYFVGLQIYKRRRMEAVSHSLVFPITKPIFKYGVTFCSMLLGGGYFGEMQDGIAWIISGYVFGALIGYAAAEMVLQKSWRVTIHVKGLMIYTAVMAALFVLFQFDLTQYEKSIPRSNEIERVYFSDNFYLYSDADHEEPLYLKEYENIDLVRRFHEKLVEDEHRHEHVSGRDSVFIVYELKNGEKLVRSYSINKREYKPFLKLIYESKEYKMATNEIFQVSSDETAKITITPTGPVTKRVVITDKQELMEAVEILTEEVETASYEELQGDYEPYADIEIYHKDSKKAYMTWNPAYKRFEEWLETKSLLKDAKVNSNDISFALAAKVEDIEINFAAGYSYEEIFEEMTDSRSSIKITDKEKIESILRNSNGSYEGDFIIAFYFDEQRSIDIKWFTEKTVPNFIKKRLQ